MKTMRLVLNGKASGSPEVRTAVAEMRAHGYDLSVRVTWEAGDGERYAQEAVDEGISVVVAGGGDGTLNEVINGVMKTDELLKSAVAVMPMGTANDFATSCAIPGDPFQALKLAAQGEARHIDIAKANERYFVNVASGGFGARVTSSTSTEAKRLLGAAAYVFKGFASALSEPISRRVSINTLDGIREETLIMVSVGNGRQSGGGFRIAPHALIDDGLLDVTFVRELPLFEALSLARELAEPDAASNQFVFAVRTPWLKVEALEGDLKNLNLDGEPVSAASSYRFEVATRAIPFVLPPGAAPMLTQKQI